MNCPNCKLDTLNEEKDTVICSNCGFRAPLLEYNIWKKIYVTHSPKFHESEEIYVKAPYRASAKVTNFSKSGVKKISPVGFYFLIALGSILGFFAGGIVIIFIFAANWVASTLYNPLQANTTTVLLFSVIAATAFLIWLTHLALEYK